MLLRLNKKTKEKMMNKVRVINCFNLSHNLIIVYNSSHILSTIKRKLKTNFFVQSFCFNNFIVCYSSEVFLENFCPFSFLYCLQYHCHHLFSSRQISSIIVKQIAKTKK